jgi:hypothetical protein
VLHQFVQGRIADYNPDKPDLPVNSPNAHYAISEVALSVIQKYGTSEWDTAVTEFKEQIGTLTEAYEKERALHLVPVTINGEEIKLSAGKHNEVQAAVIEQFAPRFASGAKVLYLGDTANKDLFVDKEGLEKIGIPITEHSKLPDVVIYDEEREWLYLVEVVTSHGPVSPKRMLELEDFFKDCR